MIDHVGITVRDLTRAAEFYDRTLAVLGHHRRKAHDDAIGYGTHGPVFWLNQAPDVAVPVSPSTVPDHAGPLAPSSTLPPSTLPSSTPPPSPVQPGALSGAPTHIAFSAPDVETVKAWFAEAVAAGATVLHPPRLWPEYDASYYGAFVVDPDGNNVEACCRTAGPIDPRAKG